MLALRGPPESLEQKDRSVPKAFRVLPVWLVLLAQTVQRELKVLLVLQAPLESPVQLGLMALTEQPVLKDHKESRE